MRTFFFYTLVLSISACQSNNAPAEVIDANTQLLDGGAGLSGAKDSSIPVVGNGGKGGNGGAPAAGGYGGSTNTSDASREGAGGAPKPRDDGGPIATDAGSDGGPIATNAGSDARLVQPDAGPRKPVFTKTACIDPNTITTEADTNFPCDGVDVWVALPNQCKTRACGLIFNIHGGAMRNKSSMEDATNMISLGKANDFVVVHPHKGTWSVSTDKNVVFSLMEQAIKAFDVDRKRIHATGYSQGGQISWALACEHADVIASVAPTEEYNQVSECWKSAKLPARELPILYAYGKQDNIGGGYDTAQTQVEQVVTSHSMTGPKTIAGADGTNYHRQRWESASGNVLEFITHNYSGLLGGHCLPLKGASTFVNCNGTFDYNWGDEVVLFFKAHPMP